tara:strand:- start:26 stop:880 length:855 start_codon:yes stop_codon:yes gene_type:complete
MAPKGFGYRGGSGSGSGRNPDTDTGGFSGNQRIPDGSGFQRPGGGDGDIYNSGMGSNRSPDQGSNINITTQPKGQKGSSNKYLAAGAGGYFFWLMGRNNDPNEKKRQACKRYCVPQNWDEFVGYDEALLKSCEEFGDDEKEEKGCKPNSLKDDDGKEIGHQLGEDYCKNEYGDNWEEDCIYYKSEKPKRGDLIWQPGPGREPEPGQPYCTGDLDNPIEKTCPEFCEEECNELHPKTNPFDPSTWWNGLKDTWPFSELPDNLPWTTIILVVMAVILVPIVLSLVK